MEPYKRDLEEAKNLIAFAKSLSYKSTSPITEKERLLQASGNQATRQN